MCECHDSIQLGTHDMSVWQIFCYCEESVGHSCGEKPLERTLLWIKDGKTTICVKICGPIEKANRLAASQALSFVCWPTAMQSLNQEWSYFHLITSYNINTFSSRHDKRDLLSGYAINYCYLKEVQCMVIGKGLKFWTWGWMGHSPAGMKCSQNGWIPFTDLDALLMQL